jgi:predicted ester cyclase
MPVHFTVIDIARVHNGRITEHWGVPDRFAILARLGRLPVPGD